MTTTLKTLAEMTDAELESLMGAVTRAIQLSGDPTELMAFWGALDREILRRHGH